MGKIRFKNSKGLGIVANFSNLGSKVAIKKMVKGSKLVIINDVRHGMREHWSEVIDNTITWFESHI